MKNLPPQSDAEWNEILKEALSTPEPPDALMKRAINLFQAKPSLAQALADTLSVAVRHITAVLQFDSFGSMTPAHGVRSGGSTTRQLLFAADGCEIDVRISPVNASMSTIAGQILGAAAGGTVLLQKEDAKMSVRLSEFNEFLLPNTPLGTYQLTFTLGEREIVIPALEIGPAQH
jgi:hypothetical protein